MRLIDADALQEIYMKAHNGKRFLLADDMPDMHVIELKTVDAMIQAAYKAGKEGKPLMVALNEEVAND